MLRDCNGRTTHDSRAHQGQPRNCLGAESHPIGSAEMPDLEELAGRLREVALSLPETYEDEPWGHPVFKVADNRMFASMSVGEEAVSLTVKLTAEEREIAYLLPFVSHARWVGRYGWITAQVADEETLDCALEWLLESYWLKCPAQLRAAVEVD